MNTTKNIENKQPVKIKIFGIGGAGGNTVNRMVSAGLIDTSEVEIVSINTDLQALRMSSAPIVVQIGQKTTKGQGSGGKPEIGKQAAEESIEIIRNLLSNTDMLFLTCGMGKGTGTGATPVIAKLAKEMGILTVGVVTKPFSFEGPLRMQNAEEGISELKKYVDALLIIPNEKFLEMYPNLNFSDMLYRIADDVLYKAVLSMWNVIVRTGYMNVDFSDAKNVLKDAGDIIMSVGMASDDEENKLKKAIKNALNNPFVENVKIEGAKRLLVNICGKNILANDVRVAGEYLMSQVLDKNALVFVGYVSDSIFEGNVEVTIIASGWSSSEKVRTAEKIKSAKKFKEVAKTNNITSEIKEGGEKISSYSIRKRGLRVLK
ncbi:MAG: cell division protein FtsZ [Endomicrobiia bacterium]